MRYWNIVRQRHCPLRRDIAGLGASLPTLPPLTAAKMAENPRLSRDGGETRRETDCPLEGNGFELPVPREISSGFEASAELRPIDRRRAVSFGQSSASVTNRAADRRRQTPN